MPTCHASAKSVGTFHTFHSGYLRYSSVLAHPLTGPFFFPGPHPIAISPRRLKQVVEEEKGNKKRLVAKHTKDKMQRDLHRRKAKMAVEKQVRWY